MFPLFLLTAEAGFNEEKVTFSTPLSPALTHLLQNAEISSPWSE